MKTLDNLLSYLQSDLHILYSAPKIQTKINYIQNTYKKYTHNRDTNMHIRFSLFGNQTSISDFKVARILVEAFFGFVS